MTYNETRKEIARLRKEKENCYHYEKVWEEKMACWGQGTFTGTGEYYEMDRRVYDKEKQVEIQKQIDALYETIKEEDERRKEEAKRRRYEKELIELKDRIEYLEKWLDNYSIENK